MPACQETPRNPCSQIPRKTSVRSSSVEALPWMTDFQSAGGLPLTVRGCKPAAVRERSQNPGNHGWSSALDGIPNSCSVAGEHIHARLPRCIRPRAGHSCSVADGQMPARDSCCIHRLSSHSRSAVDGRIPAHLSRYIRHRTRHSCWRVRPLLPIANLRVVRRQGSPNRPPWSSANCSSSY